MGPRRTKAPRPSSRSNIRAIASEGIREVWRRGRERMRSRCRKTTGPGAAGLSRVYHDDAAFSQSERVLERSDRISRSLALVGTGRPNQGLSFKGTSRYVACLSAAGLSPVWRGSSCLQIREAGHLRNYKWRSFVPRWPLNIMLLASRHNDIDLADLA